MPIVSRQPFGAHDLYGLFAHRGERPIFNEIADYLSALIAAMKSDVATAKLVKWSPSIIFIVSGAPVSLISDVEIDAAFRKNASSLPI